MKLRNIIHSAAMAAVAIALGSCTPIDENERLIEVEKPQANRAVLIEDFTGQWCPNCPNAAEEIEKLAETYGSDQIIAVAIHSGPQGYQGGTEDMPGLMTNLGTEYYNHWGIEYQPQGLVDRGGKEAYTAWAASVRTELQKTALYQIEVANDYATASRQLNITAHVTPVKGVEQLNGKLQIWLIEDNIKSIQVNSEGQYLTDYMHQHVFRDAVNGTWGEEISLTEDSQVEKTYSYTIPANWKPENVSVVAFVYDDHGVQQVVKQPILQK